MEDNSLDDFFAKKDKSRKKSKVKSVEVVDDDGTKSTKKEKKKDKSNKSSSSNSSSNKSSDKRKDDDEWNDFEEEKAADYSNLRIQTLQAKEDGEKDTEGEEEEFDENGEVREKKDGASGPWNKSNNPTGTSATEEDKPAPAPVQSGKYIPPSQRAAMAAAASGASGPGSRRKKVLPNIRSDFDFPTLATGPGQTSTPQTVSETTNQRRGGGGGGLATSNKFSVLQD